jgi:electron transport complex protein RnfD
MSQAQPDLILASSPFLKHQEDTSGIMWHVFISLLPVIGLAAWLFGTSAVLLIAVCTISTLATEWAFTRGTVRDGSAALTGLLLALTLPPSLPLWMAAVGGVVAIVAGKLVFGGLGYNVFNPALVGRAFLQAAFPAAMTTWVAPAAAEVRWQPLSSSLANPGFQGVLDGVTSATPLAAVTGPAAVATFSELAGGRTAGSLGETSAALILLAGLYLAARGLLNWRIPVAIFLSVFVVALALHALVPARCAPPLYHLGAGGLMLGAVFMATDMVTSPVTQRGCWVYGFGIGVLVVVIRVFGGLPEGVMYAILLMNGMTPLINRATQPRVFGED